VSARASCADCGWNQRYRHPSRARREAASHRCDPPGPRRQAITEPLLSSDPAGLLEEAADRAYGQPTAHSAIAAAAALLRADRGQGPAALVAWREAEQYSPAPGGFTALLRARYTAPGQVAGSLRAAGLHLARAA
jgi:hypothetical protein